MNKERIEIEKINKKLVGFWYKAKANNKDIVIVCHGYNSNSENRIVTEICESLNKEGYDVFKFNFSGYGDSDGKREDSSFRKQYSDLKSVLDHFSKEDYNIKSVVGHSTGGTVAILGAAYDNDKRIKSIILIAPRIYPSKSTMARKIEEKHCKTLDELIKDLKDKDSKVEDPVEVKIHDEQHRFSKTYVEEIARLDVIRALKRIECPILILHGDKDEVVDIEEGKTAEIESKEATFFPIHSADNADHFFKGHHLNEAIEIISSWLKQGKIDRWKKNWANWRFEYHYSLLCPTIKKGILFLLILLFLSIIFCSIFLPDKFYLINLSLSERNKQIEVTGWWAILALISGLTISYVGFINRLREKFPKIRMKRWDFKRERKEREISWNMVLLSWAVFFMFITISAITLRIFCIYTNYSLSPPRVYGIILYSFAISTLFRIWLFLDSHWENLISYLFTHHRDK